MELLQLQYFQVVARLENMTRAAEELHIAQPSLSKTIARLEAQVGVPLFERQGRKIKLNQFGQLFLKRVNQSLLALEEGLQEISDLIGAEYGSVVIGTATSRLLPGLIRQYLSLHPHVKFRLLQIVQHTELLQQLHNGDIDLSISSLPLSGESIICEPLTCEEIFLAIPLGHRLADQQCVVLSELEEEPLIYYTAETGLRKILDDFCQEARFTPQIAFECTTPEITCGLVNAGLGIAFLPDYLWRTVNTAALAKVAIESPSCQRTIWLSWRADRYLSQAAQNFRQIARDHFH